MGGRDLKSLPWGLGCVRPVGFEPTTRRVRVACSDQTELQTRVAPGRAGAQSPRPDSNRHPSAYKAAALPDELLGHADLRRRSAPRRWWGGAVGAGDRIRTGVTCLEGRGPRPLDDTRTRPGWGLWRSPRVVAWLGWSGSNARPRGYEPRALPTELHPTGTCAPLTRFELATSGLTGRRALLAALQGHVLLVGTGRGDRARTCDTRCVRPLLYPLSYTPGLNPPVGGSRVCCLRIWVYGA